MNKSEKPIETEAKQESRIRIGEVYIDEGLEDIVGKAELVQEVQKMDIEIGEYLGENENPTIYDFRIYSDREEYESYLKTNFPDEFEGTKIDNAVFHYDKGSGEGALIAVYVEKEALDPDDPKVQEYLKEEDISFDELEARAKSNLKNNIYPGIAHEMTHLHPFFGGVGNEASENKWEQEMVCVFIDSKMWEKYGNDDFIEKIKLKAQEQSQEKDFYEEIKKDFQEGGFEIEEWERLFYPFLEKRYGKDKLVNFFSDLFKNKSDIEMAFKTAFGDDLKDATKLFQEEINNN